MRRHILVVWKLFGPSVYSLREKFCFSGAVPGNAWRLIPGLIAAFSRLGLPPASLPFLLISPPCAPPSPCSTQSSLSALHLPLNLLALHHLRALHRASLTALHLPLNLLALHHLRALHRASLTALHLPLNLLSAPLYTQSLRSPLSIPLSTKILFLSFGGKFVHLQVNKSRRASADTS